MIKRFQLFSLSRYFALILLISVLFTEMWQHLELKCDNKYQNKILKNILDTHSF